MEGERGERRQAHVRFILLCDLCEVYNQLKGTLIASLEEQHDVVEELVGELELLPTKLPCHENEHRVPRFGIATLMMRRRKRRRRRRRRRRTRTRRKRRRRRRGRRGRRRRRRRKRRRRRREDTQ